MTYELRTYTLKPNTQADAERLLNGAQDRPAIAASWYTEIGPLNELVQLRVTGQTANPEQAAEAEKLVVDVRIDPLVAFPFSPPLPAARVGPYFEIRQYDFEPAELPKIDALWGRALPARLALSPLVGLWYSPHEPNHRLIHVWAYASLDERQRIRAQAAADRIWPPNALAGSAAERYRLVTMQTKIVLAAPSSPLQ